MLFNSYAYLLGFLPLALVAYRIADPRPAWRLPCLLALSLLFYGYWDPRFLALLIPSILINWLAARLYLATRRGAVVTAAIVANLVVLGVFKYANFLAASAAGALGVAFHPFDVALPLGISFFTFHHIMYLVDLRRGLATGYPLDKYALYICFFPQVLSGPLVRWSEVMHQFGRAAFDDGWPQRFAAGLALIVLGLAQKVFLGDPLGEMVTPIFQGAEAAPPAGGTAWIAVLGFTFQIFFDFSGYSDIAIGTALLFGIVLPLNFDGPYRATSIRDFWRKWHMTLSRFLRDYLYVPLGGNRAGFRRRVLAVMITMTLGGLWHGAGWNFVLWGVLHGVAIAAAVVWAKWRLPMPTALGWLLTFAFVAMTWVFFRSATFGGALNVLQGLAVPPGAGMNGWRTIAIAAFCAIALPPSHRIVAWLTRDPRPAVAVALALVGVAVMAQLGREGTYEFIYFQF